MYSAYIRRYFQRWIICAHKQVPWDMDVFCVRTQIFLEMNLAFQRWIIFAHEQVPRQKNNNCVVRVTPEKTLGRVHVGRYFLFFYIFFAIAGCHKKRLSNFLNDREQFRILKVRSSAACSHFGLKIFSKTLTDSISFNAEMGEKKKPEVADVRLYDLP